MYYTGMCILLDHLDVSSSFGSLASVLPLKDCPPVGIQLDGGDNDVARVDSDGGGGTVGLVPLDTVDVNNPFLAVDLGDLALTAFVLSADNADLVIFANGQRAAVVLATELLREGRRHDLAADG